MTTIGDAGRRSARERTAADETGEPAAASGWHPTACILCTVNCGVEIRLGDGGHFARVRGDKSHPTSRGYTCEKALRLDYYQHGAHRLTTPLRHGRRDVRADRLGHGDRRGRATARRDPRRPRRRVDLLLRRRRAGEPLRRGVRWSDAFGARQRLLLERTGTGEDGRVLGRRPALRQDALPHDRRLRARRGRCVPRQEPVALARVPAGAHGSEGDRQ